MTDLCRRGIRKTSSDTCVDLYILLLKYLSNHMHAITNGLFKHLFSTTNSTDPRQRVPLSPNLHRLNLCSTHLRISLRKEGRDVTFTSNSQEVWTGLNWSKRRVETYYFFRTTPPQLQFVITCVFTASMYYFWRGQTLYKLICYLSNVPYTIIKFR